MDSVHVVDAVMEDLVMVVTSIILIGAITIIVVDMVMAMRTIVVEDSEELVTNRISSSEKIHLMGKSVCSCFFCNVENIFASFTHLAKWSYVATFVAVEEIQLCESVKSPCANLVFDGQYYKFDLYAVLKI
ncbi:hypothetical protein OESDEN_18046 [Oesophagostomum dentatum]|uniref:Uncharacterized protein n=1 Tax=Oesophagostomum dentatum TaxID=61180 RepID=A0A0B1SFE8_OESDE|nr:hypothetical protein OESDEN_18046 [Oesophagostomum dentatum]